MVAHGSQEVWRCVVGNIEAGRTLLEKFFDLRGIELSDGRVVFCLRVGTRRRPTITTAGSFALRRAPGIPGQSRQCLLSPAISSGGIGAASRILVLAIGLSRPPPAAGDC